MFSKIKCKLKAKRDRKYMDYKNNNKIIKICI